jgi:hypothetical protein
LGGAPGRLQSYGPRFISRRRLIHRLVKAIKPLRTLDIGCGSGLITKVLDEQAGHVRRYTREELRHKLTERGFEIVRMINWGFPVTRWLYFLEVRLLLRGSASQSRGKGHRPTGHRLLLPLLALTRPLFAVLADLESLFSGLDRGVGHVVLARKATTR